MRELRKFEKISNSDFEMRIQFENCMDKDIVRELKNLKNLLCCVFFLLFVVFSENLNFRMRDSVNSNAAIQANTRNQNLVLGLKLYISGKITGQNIKYLQ